MTIYYLDSSAFLKLFKPESESKAFRIWLSSLNEKDLLTSSDLMKAEVIRVIKRHLPDQVSTVLDFLNSVTTMRITNQVLQLAAELGPVELGTLDAIHLASARTACSPEDCFVSYDKKLLVSAELNGLEVLSPGA